MLKPYKSNITDIAVVFAHAGTREDQGNRIYSIAATILSLNASPRTFESFVRYAYLTARDRYYSNISKETLANAPEVSTVFPQVKSFLKDTDIILTLPYQDNFEEIIKIFPDKRIINLGFAVEFFLPHVDSFSPKRLWEYLHKQERKRIYFAASEVVALSIDLLEDICGNALNDVVLPRAAAIRYYLKKSNTLFGDLFLHFVNNYEKYFDALFNPRQNPDTESWQTFLEHVSAKRQNINKTEPTEKIRIEKLESIYRGLSQSEKGFSFRTLQVEYANHVAQAINDEAVLTIEAGTGTGKTQGYLIPVMEYLSRNPDERIAVSTYTKSLQDQIFQQEIAFIKNANKMYRDVPVSLLKGKSNYICAAKLGHVYDETWEGPRLLTWLYFVNLTYHYRDADGDQTGPRIIHYLQDGPFFYQIQREVSARSGCDPKHTRCPAQIVSAEALASRLMVTNHHKLILLNHDPILKGLFKTYIIDEANHFEQAAGNALGQEFNSRDAVGCMDYIESALSKPLGRAVNDVEKNVKESLAAIADLKKEIIRIGEILKSIRGQRKQSGGHQELPANHALFKEGAVIKHLESLRAEINQIAEHLKWLKDADICRMLKIQERTQERMKRNLDDLQEQGLSLKAMTDAYTKQNQILTYDVFSRHWTLLSRPVDVSNLIRENLYRDTEGLIYTSATICMDGNYETFKQIVGTDRPFFLNKEKSAEREFRHVFLGSSFSPDRMEMIVPPETPSGDYQNKSAWMDFIVKALPDLIKKNKGRTLVLFSSYADLEAVAKRIGNDIVEAGYPLLVQRNGYPTGDLCDEFRAVKESVLFGVDTFWYGVDFKGDTLTQVIITRIPYPHPGDAMNMARKKILHPAKYMDRYLYDTFIKIKQGIGRLIRCETDHGRVVVLDSRFHRIKNKFIKQNENKAVALHEMEDRKDQVQITLDDQVSDLQNDSYIYHCGECGEEIRADATVCPACKQKFKQDRNPPHQKQNFEYVDIQKTPNDIKKENAPGTVKYFINDMCTLDANLQERGRILHQVYRKWHYDRCNDEKPMPRRAFWTHLENYEKIVKISDNPRVFSGIRLKNNTYDNETLEFQDDLQGVAKPLGENLCCETEMIKHVISKIPIKRPLNTITDRRIFKIRQRYLRAYEPWSNEEDMLLLKLCKEKWKTSMLAEIFQRQPGAITSRIKKLTDH
jgi:ATP-dependent DNA helicase DinG